MDHNISKKNILRQYNTILKIGVNDLREGKLKTLLKHRKSFAFSKGSRGISCGYYCVDGVCISMGDYPIGENVDDNLISEYELKAKEIYKITELSTYKERCKTADILLSEFVKKATAKINETRL